MNETRKGFLKFFDDKSSDDLESSLLVNKTYIDPYFREEKELDTAEAFRHISTWEYKGSRYYTKEDVDVLRRMIVWYSQDYKRRQFRQATFSNPQ